MKDLIQPEESLKEVQKDIICPDFDEDCLKMTSSHATWCFLGCQNHPCSPEFNLGTAQGKCPIIQKDN